MGLSGFAFFTPRVRPAYLILFIDCYGYQLGPLFSAGEVGAMEIWKEFSKQRKQWEEVRDEEEEEREKELRWGWGEVEKD